MVSNKIILARFILIKYELPFFFNSLIFYIQKTLYFLFNVQGLIGLLQSFFPRLMFALGEYKTFFRSKFSMPTEVFFLALGVLLVTGSIWLWERYQAYKAWTEGRDKAAELR